MLLLMLMHVCRLLERRCESCVLAWRDGMARSKLQTDCTMKNETPQVSQAHVACVNQRILCVCVTWCVPCVCVHVHECVCACGCICARGEGAYRQEMSKGCISEMRQAASHSQEVQTFSTDPE